MDVTALRSRICELKQQEPVNSLIGFVMGDFVEFFMEDAVAVSNALNIVLTDRGRHLGTPIPMCGIPTAHFVDRAHWLEDLGFKIGIAPERSESIVSDAVSVSWRDLTDDQRSAAIAAAAAAEKCWLRSVCLHERLAAHGLEREADLLGVRGMACFGREDHLDALEAIVATLEQSTWDGAAVH